MEGADSREIRLNPVNRFLWLLRRSLIASFDDGLFAIAKGAAYSALLSLFPVLASVATLFVEFRAGYAQRVAMRFLTRILPPGTEDIVLQQFRYRGQRPVSLLVVAFLLSLWAASSVIKSLVDGFNAAYRVPRNRSIPGHAATGLMLVFLAAVPMIGATSLILFGSSIEAAFRPFSPGWELFSRIVRFAIAFAATATISAMLYFYGPYRKQSWRGVWPGALLATALWLVATSVFAWYVRNITNYNLLYGSIGTSIALLIWMYLLAAINLYGCEFNAELERTNLIRG